MLRRLIFSLKETEPEPVRRMFEFGGRGRYGLTTKPIAREPFDLYIPAIRSRGDVDWNDADAISRWVQAQLAAQDVELY